MIRPGSPVFQEIGEVVPEQLDVRDIHHAVSHGISTPLTAAREFVSLVLDGLAGKVNAQQKEFLSLAVESCDQISAQFEELMDALRITAGNLDLKPTEIRLSLALNDALSRVEQMALERRVSLLSEIEPSAATVFADQGRLGGILSHLLRNAVAATPAGGEVVVHAAANGLDEWEISVADNGCGIPRAELGLIFERFYQVRRPAGTPACGLGLGLSLARELVRLHRGDIEVTSMVGQGTRFTVRLPMAAKH